MADDKKKQAMSLLFGDAPPKPKRSRRASRSTERKEEPDAPLTETTPTLPKPTRPEQVPVSPASSSATAAEETPDPYYEGQSRYRRRDGTEVKHSIYLDEEVSRALKLAAARGDDPRGTSMSAIVNQALRDLGYR